MVSAAVVEGNLFVAVATDGDPTNDQGGLFRRIDGPEPTWELVYEWPDTGNIRLGKNMRGLTPVSDPEGSGRQMLIGVIENLEQIVRIDPETGEVVEIELDLEEFWDRLWGDDANFHYAAYNNMLPMINPETGRPVHFIGVWVIHPKPWGTVERNAAYFLIRHEDGTYDWGQVRDETIPTPPGSGLQALRTIAPSPFEGEVGSVWYVGGKDAGGKLPRFHNTAWIYRATLDLRGKTLP
jgi:hypothetical protein